MTMLILSVQIRKRFAHQCLDNVKIISMQNLIKYTIGFKSYEYFRQAKRGTVKPCHLFAYQLLDNVKINKYAKIDPKIPFSSRVMSSLLTDHDRPE